MSYDYTSFLTSNSKMSIENGQIQINDVFNITKEKVNNTTFEVVITGMGGAIFTMIFGTQTEVDNFYTEVTSRMTSERV